MFETKYVNTYKNKMFLEDFEELIQKKYYSELEVKALIIENACVLPFRSVKPGAVTGFGGVVDGKGYYVKESAIEIEGIMPKGYNVTGEIRSSDEHVVYLGYFMSQWGHFLVDFLPRVWWLLEHDKDTKVIYLSKDEDTIISGNYLAILELIGVNRERIHRINSVTKYREVVVPELAMKRPYYWTNEYRKIINQIVSSVPECSKQYKKIYWTRTRFDKAQDSEIGEKEIEKFFKKNGYKVLAPEKCTLEEQIYLFSHCDEFAALSGTISHNIVFAAATCVKRSKPCLVTILNKTHRINTIQLLLNDFAQAEIIDVDCNLGALPVSPAAGPFWVGINENVEKYARNRKMKITKKSFLMGYKTRRNYIKYCLMYARIVQDSSVDLDGIVVGSSRPFVENKKVEPIWYHYRKQLGVFPTYTSSGYLLKKVLRKIKKLGRATFGRK